MAAYTARNFDCLLGTAGFSDTLLKNHFTLYQGYVTNSNKLADALSAMAKEGKTGSPDYAEFKRRFGWEFNGMRLHEFYFENMTKGGKPADKRGKIVTALTAQWGSYEAWEKDFRSTGAMRGIGWACLYHDPVGKNLFNCWVNEHDVGHLAGCNLLLIMDVFEHAFMIDYGLKRADYIESFMKAVDWSVVEKRASGL